MNKTAKWNVERKVVLFFSLESHMKKLTNDALHIFVGFKTKADKSAAGFSFLIFEVCLFVLLFRKIGCFDSKYF